MCYLFWVASEFEDTLFSFPDPYRFPLSCEAANRATLRPRRWLFSLPLMGKCAFILKRLWQQAAE